MEPLPPARRVHVLLVRCLAKEALPHALLTQTIERPSRRRTPVVHTVQLIRHMRSKTSDLRIPRALSSGP